MIPRQEIIELAGDFGLDANVVEKDYALGWILAGIAEHPDTREAWIFKGGTCLKKCFFETYRFSEDLDFTLVDVDQFDEQLLTRIVNEIADWVYDATGMEMPTSARRLEVYANDRGGISAEGRIGYRGPLGRAGDAPRIKLDLTGDERLVLPVERRSVHHPYSDRPEDGFSVATYAFDEIFAEKIRALAQRMRPRDLYDVIHLFRRRESFTSGGGVLTVLRTKCEHRGMILPTLESLSASELREPLGTDWVQMLRHQLPQLPSMADFWNALSEVFAWLREAPSPTPLRELVVPSAGRLDASWRAPRMAVSWRSQGVSAPLEIVRFAAANRLCIELDYRDETGNRSTRTLEPYSLRRTTEGRLLLFGVRADSGAVRSYRVDRIHGVAASAQSFVPRYRVEFGGYDEGAVAMGSLGTLGTRRSPSRPAGPAQARRAGRRALLSQSGPTYVLQCTVCGKRFRRRSLDYALKPHNGKQGRPCYGSIGRLVKTEY